VDSGCPLENWPSSVVTTINVGAQSNLGDTRSPNVAIAIFIFATLPFLQVRTAIGAPPSGFVERTVSKYTPRIRDRQPP
jgi:hypothetical protein